MTDNTTKTIARQLNYLACSSYEIGIYNRNSDRMELRTFTAKTIFKSINFLKYRNINGHDIFIRPEGPSGFVFIDDLSVSDLTKMGNDGYMLNVAIESSPLNYQGWLKVSESPIPTETASIVGRYLARKYGADMRSSDWRHFGRLAGFTNRKPAYVDEIGQYPFVSIYDVSNKMCPNPKELFSEAIDEHEKQQAKKSRPMNYSSKLRTSSNPIEVYQTEIEVLKSFWGAKYNSSDGDWNAVLKMITSGFNANQISDVLFDKSESVAKRSVPRANDYVQRTITNAFNVINK